MQGGSAICLVVDVMGDLLGDDGQKLIESKRWVSNILYSINEGHQCSIRHLVYALAVFGVPISFMCFLQP